MDDRARLAAMDANLAVHMSWLQARLPGGHVPDAPDLLLVDSGFPTDTFNCVCRARLAPERAPARVGQTLAHFERVGRPFAWWLGPLDRPTDLWRALEGAGLTSAEGELAMAADLADLPPFEVAPGGLSVERATTPAAVADFAQVVAANWSPPDLEVVAYYRAATSLLLAGDCPIRLYVGRLGDRPVAAAELCLTAGAAGLYSVCTLAAERRRGFGTALTAAPLLDARAEGNPLGVLQASEQGQHVYRRLGFRPLGDYVEYKPRSPA
jgi:ribosomal protein S18 acetylase RimI-like enzyme